MVVDIVFVFITGLIKMKMWTVLVVYAALLIFMIAAILIDALIINPMMIHIFRYKEKPTQHDQEW